MQGLLWQLRGRVPETYVTRRGHPFLEKNPKVGTIRRRRLGERPTGEPDFRLEDQEGVLWKKIRDEHDKPPSAD